MELELAGDHTERLARALGGLTRHAAPPILEERIARFLRVDPSSDELRRAQAVGALEIQSAPAVLERLIDEELEAPERLQAERFSGSLPRLSAPEELDERIRSGLRRKTLRRLWIAPVATLAAACLVVWLTLRSDRPASHRYRFDVIQSASLESIDPTARALAEVLAGVPGTRPR